MMFAQAEDLDIPYDDHLVVFLVEDSICDDITQSDLVTPCHPQQRLCIPLWCLYEATSGRIFADTFEYGLDSFRETGLVCGCLGRGMIKAVESGFCGPAEAVGVHDGGGSAGGSPCRANVSAFARRGAQSSASSGGKSVKVGGDASGGSAVLGVAA